jgi:transcriptional regulator with XRE-family HTH domain
MNINIVNRFVKPPQSGQKMRSLAELARQRIVAWMAANRGITQMDVAKAVGVSQSWVSQYKSGDVDADIDQLDAMARVFGHTLMELLDLRPDPKERDLVEAYRRLRPQARALAVQMLEAMIPPSEHGRTRARNGDK